MRPVAHQSAVKTLSAGVFVVALLAVLASGRPAYGQTTLTYENWGEGFFTQTCCGCHNSNLSGANRFGAPEGVDFDTLDLIRAQEIEIRDAALGDFRFMPPMGVTWPWDRDNLREWLDAGMPGAADSVTPVQKSNNEVSIDYQTSWFYFSQPQRDEKTNSEERDFNFRFIEIERASERDDMVPENHRVFIRRRDDGTVVMTAQRWGSEEDGTRMLDYTPGVPVLPNGGDLNAPEWFSTVQVRERFWSAETWRHPDYENIQTEQWMVKVQGIETLDNGVMIPVTALKVVQSNLTNSVDTSWWFARGLGVVRRETNEPAFDFDRVRTVQYNIIRDDDPLRNPPIVRSASAEWLPFVGPDYNPAENRTESWRMDYSYQFDFQQIGVVNSTVTEDPTPTSPPLGSDPTATPIQPTPTFTPVGFDPQPTSPSGGNPGGYPPDDPRASNLVVDNLIDQKDLLMFLQHWHKTIE